MLTVEHIFRRHQVHVQSEILDLILAYMESFPGILLVFLVHRTITAGSDALDRLHRHMAVEEIRLLRIVRCLRQFQTLLRLNDDPVALVTRIIIGAERIAAVRAFKAHRNHIGIGRNGLVFRFGFRILYFHFICIIHFDCFTHKISGEETHGFIRGRNRLSPFQQRPCVAMLN